MAIVFALVAAALFAVGSVFQQDEAAARPAGAESAVGLFRRLAQRPRWLLGVAGDGGGYVVQAIALDAGRLVVVQPLLVTTLLFAMPLAAVVKRRRISWRELALAFTVTAGLVGFVALATFSRGRARVTGEEWFYVLVVTAFVGCALVVAGRNRGASARAALLGAAAGLTWGVTSALTKTVMGELDHGVSRVVTHWPLYVVLVSGAVGMLLAQRAFEAGPISASLPVLTILDPVVSALLGVFLYHERLGLSDPRNLASLACVAVAFTAVVALARSRGPSPLAAIAAPCAQQRLLRPPATSREVITRMPA